MPENRPDSRFAADVDYRGRAGRHDYVVRVRHRLLDTAFTVVIDGVEHDPKIEEKARKAQEKKEGARARARADGDGEEDPGTGDGSAADDDPNAGDDPNTGDDSAPGQQADDDLRFTVEEGFTTLRCTVRRPREDDGHKDAEVISIRTAGLGGAGEVEIRHGFQNTVLAPSDGSPSAARDAKRTAHPTRYALIAAFTRSARYLLPLLGLGALFSGLLDPLKEWVEARVRSVIDAIARVTAPPREWLAELLQPLRDRVAELLEPLRDLLEWLLRPLRDLLAWLLGLLPDVALPFDVPGWVVDVLVAVIVVVAVFLATRRGLEERRKKLAETRTGRDETDDGEDEVEVEGGDEDAGEGADKGVDEAVRGAG